MDKELREKLDDIEWRLKIILVAIVIFSII